MVETDFLDASFLPRDDIHFTTAIRWVVPMGTSKEQGVVDASGEVFDCERGWDGAPPSPPAVNTSPLASTTPCSLESAIRHDPT